MEEFDLIARYFAPLADQAGLGLMDDAACFKPSLGKDLVVSKDMLVAGTHFFATDKPDDVAFKSISVNVSDIVAKGAEPLYYLLGLSLPKNVPETWVKVFTEGLWQAQEKYGIALVGGDTTSTEGPVTVSVTAIGQVSAGQMVKRSSAKEGDCIYVSGTLGDAALGLESIKGSLPRRDCFLQRYYRPEARAALGMNLLGLASASTDVSDGLLADVGHICKASKQGARIYLGSLPLSEDASLCVEANASLWPLVWSGGDDYEIVFTTAPENQKKVADLARTLKISLTKIGEICIGSSVALVDSKGELVQVEKRGYRHF